MTRPRLHRASRRPYALVAVALCHTALAPGLTWARVGPVDCAQFDGASIYSQESTPVYLGFIGAAVASESIFNPLGPYGSRVSPTSVNNHFGTYGSPYEPGSADNRYDSNGPLIRKWGVTIGQLSANPFLPEGVSVFELRDCDFLAPVPYWLPLPTSGVTASDGAFTDRVEIIWKAVQGANLYKVYVSDTEQGFRTLAIQTLGLTAEITSGTPGEIYYYWVSAENAAGESAALMDTGYILPVDTDGDGVYDHEDAFPGDPDESVDTDGDGTGDNADTDDDDDGLTDDEEAILGTNALLADTDGDGHSDGDEVDWGTDPRNPGSFPINKSITGRPWFQGLLGTSRP